MTPQELQKHLNNEGDSTHKAISIYLETLNSFSQGHDRRDPGVNSKKKPDSDEEEKEEEEREEEEEEVAAELDSNDVSHEQVDSYACDHAKQVLEEFAFHTRPYSNASVGRATGQGRRISLASQKSLTNLLQFYLFVICETMV